MAGVFKFEPKRRSGSGHIIDGTAGEALGNRQLVYKGADENWYLADADLAATMSTIGITVHSIAIGMRGQIILNGYIGLATWTWTTGDEIYASTTPGEITQTAPVPPDIIQIVGYAEDSTMIRFNPHAPSGGVFEDQGVFYAAPNPDAYIGQHYGAQMLDGVETIVGFEFAIPNNFHTLVSAVIEVIQITAATPNMVWSATTDFAEACSTEDYDTHEDTTGSQTDQVLQNDIVCLDISTALTGITAGDLVGLEFLRDGDEAADTVGGPVLCVGLRLRYR